MSRTGSPDEVTYSAPRTTGGVPAAAIGKWAGQLAGYAVATIAITFVLLRPRRSRAGKRGSLFLGSGVLVVLVKTVLSVGDSDGGAAHATTPALSAATPRPAAAVAPAGRPVTPAAPAAVTNMKKRPAAATSVEPHPKPFAAAPSATEQVRSKESPKPKPPAAPAPARAPAAAPVAAARAASPLGPRYADKATGFSVQFPVGWNHKPATDAGWLLDATDGKTAFISIGFSKFPAHLTLDQVPAERVTKGLQKRSGTVVHSCGYTTVAGRRCMWHKFTGPVPRGGATAKVTAVHYFMPLQDGRALELRLASSPEKFKELAPRMKQSVDSFRLLTKIADAGAR